MPGFKEIRHVAEAAEDHELACVILDCSLSSKSDLELIGLLKQSLQDPQRRERLLDMLESRKAPPVPLSSIITVLEKFSRLKEGLRSTLTEEDVKLLSFTNRYFEAWFYRGDWTAVPERPEQEPWAYFSAPAGIVNMLTKIKELPEYTERVGSFDAKRLQTLHLNLM